MRAKSILLLFLLPMLTACEQVAELLELPDPQKEAARIEAEGKAIGGACRQGGRSLEDCYILNTGAQKAAVYAGWREMNDYMIQNNMDVVPSQLSPANEPATPAAEPPPVANAPTAAPAQETRPSRRPRVGPST